MYMYMYMCMCMCMYMYMYTTILKYIGYGVYKEYTRVCSKIMFYLLQDGCVHIHIYICVYTYTYICVYIYILYLYIYICIYIYVSEAGTVAPSIGKGLAAIRCGFRLKHPIWVPGPLRIIDRPKQHTNTNL